VGVFDVCGLHNLCHVCNVCAVCNVGYSLYVCVCVCVCMCVCVCVCECVCLCVRESRVTFSSAEKHVVKGGLGGEGGGVSEMMGNHDEAARCITTPKNKTLNPLYRRTNSRRFDCREKRQQKRRVVRIADQLVRSKWV